MQREDAVESPGGAGALPAEGSAVAVAAAAAATAVPPQAPSAAEPAAIDAAANAARSRELQQEFRDLIRMDPFTALKSNGLSAILSAMNDSPGDDAVMSLALNLLHHVAAATDGFSKQSGNEDVLQQLQQILAHISPASAIALASRDVVLQCCRVVGALSALSAVCPTTGDNLIRNAMLTSGCLAFVREVLVAYSCDAYIGAAAILALRAYAADDAAKRVLVCEVLVLPAVAEVIDLQLGDELCLNEALGLLAQLAINDEDVRARFLAHDFIRSSIVPALERSPPSLAVTTAAVDIIISLISHAGAAGLKAELMGQGIVEPLLQALQEYHANVALQERAKWALRALAEGSYSRRETIECAGGAQYLLPDEEGEEEDGDA